MVTTTKMDLSGLMNPALQTGASEIMKQAPRKIERLLSNEDGLTPRTNYLGDSIDLNLSRPERHKSAAEKAVRKLSENLPEPEKRQSADILKIVSANSPNGMKALRAILASISGLESGKKPDFTLEQLGATLDAAAQSPDPGQRVTDVLSGVGLVPDDQKDKFLKAAAAILQAESENANIAAPMVRGEQTPTAEINVNPQTGNYDASNVGVTTEVNFDLFFSISARSSIKAGETSSGSFYEATSAVAANFESDFSMKIGGRFMTLADMAEKIDPKVLDAFSEAVKGLAGFDQQGLDRFFGATEKLFSEVEKDMGLRVGELGGVVSGIKATAESFFHSVSESLKGAFPGVAADQIFSLPPELDSNGSTDLLSLLNGLAENRDAAKSDAHPLMKSLSAAENSKALDNHEAAADFALPLFANFLKAPQEMMAS